MVRSHLRLPLLRALQRGCVLRDDVLLFTGPLWVQVPGVLWNQVHRPLVHSHLRYFSSYPPPSWVFYKLKNEKLKKTQGLGVYIQGELEKYRTSVPCSVFTNSDRFRQVLKLFRCSLVLCSISYFCNP